MRWKQHRKLLTPAFHFQILEQFIEVFNTQSDILVKKLYQNSNRAFDIYQSIRLYALDVICEATMSASINAQLNPTSNYVKSVKEICRIILERILSIKMWDLAYVFSKDYYKEKQAIKILHALSNSIINNRREELLDQDLSNLADVVTWKSTKKVAFLDLLLKSTINGKSLPHKDIREEVDTFMFEGHDTTTSGLSFVLYCLSKHQDIQCKVFDEINEFVVDDAKLQLSYGNLQKLKYLEQVIKETLRMYPPVPMYSRVTTEDTSYQDVILPKGVTVTVSAYHLHHNPSVYSKPEVFDPERFNMDNSKNISVYSYIPFSAGPRNCIGQKFAMLEIKSTVCKILQQFKLLPVLEHEPILIANVILTSANGLPVYLETR
ncbi:hypothetical protein FQR65_LT03769 [Abscondita terminalis]|nr:hypothetical protein FQR65_LT03769 [Abscondita terminalis]